MSPYPLGTRVTCWEPAARFLPQMGPVNSGLHRHSNLTWVCCRQVPPFRHGSAVQVVTARLQVLSTKPAGQRQRKSPPMSVQMPWFSHGFGVQLLATISQKLPEKPGGHRQEAWDAWPSSSTQVPPCWQGELQTDRGHGEGPWQAGLGWRRWGRGAAVGLPSPYTSGA